MYSAKKKFSYAGEISLFRFVIWTGAIRIWWFQAANHIVNWSPYVKRGKRNEFSYLAVDRKDSVILHGSKYEINEYNRQRTYLNLNYFRLFSRKRVSFSLYVYSEIARTRFLKCGMRKGTKGYAVVNKPRIFERCLISIYTCVVYSKLPNNCGSPYRDY